MQESVNKLISSLAIVTYFNMGYFANLTVTFCAQNLKQFCKKKSLNMFFLNFIPAVLDGICPYNIWLGSVLGGWSDSLVY